MDNPEKPFLVDFDLESAVPYLVNRVGVRMGESFSGELRRFGLTLAGWRVLASLLHREGQTPSELAEHTSIELSTLSRLLSVLHQKELLKRAKNGADKRSVRVSLTVSGKTLTAQIIPLADLYDRIALAGVSQREAALFKRVLLRVHDNIAGLTARPNAGTGIC